MPTETQKVQAALAERLSSFPLISPAAPAPWPFADLTDQQQRERALLEIAYRAGTLRGIPSVFGALA